MHLRAAQGTDRSGRPVVYINVALHKASDQPQKVIRSDLPYGLLAYAAVVTGRLCRLSNGIGSHASSTSSR